MSKKSIELANNKRTKILNDLQKNRKIETIELYHILSYKKEIGKYTVSKIEEGAAFTCVAVVLKFWRFVEATCRQRNSLKIGGLHKI